MIKGVEDYEKDLEENHIDDTGKLAEIIDKPASSTEKPEENSESTGKMRSALKEGVKKKDPSDNLSIEDLLKEI